MRMHLTALKELPEHVLGATRVRILMPASATGGAYEVIELRGEPGAMGPRPHLHRRSDELFTVLEGALAMEVAGRAIDAPAGTTVHVPRGAPHAFRYAAPGTRFLAMLTPGTGFDQYLAGALELLRKAREGGGGPPDPAKLGELMAQFDQYPA